MGNNRSILVSGSTATTASLNSTSSLPCNPCNTVNKISATPPTQSSVSFLKRFRHPNLSSHNNLDELDHVEVKKKNQKTNLNMNRKKTKQLPNDLNNIGITTKKLERNKIISLSATNIIVHKYNSKVGSSNECEYTSIDNDNCLHAATSEEKMSANLPKIESFYESTFEMDLANNNNNVKQPVIMPPPPTQSQITTVKKALNKENSSEIRDDTSANLYSEIINKTLSSSNNHHHHSNQFAPPIPPPLNKKNHMQPITNFFNKLTKTTKAPENNNIQERPDSLSGLAAPIVPTKAFNPSKEFFTDLMPTSTTRAYVEFEEEYYEDEIYSKIDKSTNVADGDEKLNLPPLPTTHVPLLNEEIEACLNFRPDIQSNYNEYQMVQDYEFITQDTKNSPNSPPKKPLIYTTIEPLNINNQVYYSFTSDSQEHFDYLQSELPSDFISRVDVKCDNSDERTYIEINPEARNGICKRSNLNLINEIENSRNHVTVKL